MTVAVPDKTAPPSPWRPPPSDPQPLSTASASQSLGLCYHGNFSLAFLDGGRDVGDDVVDADDIRAILDLAEQCAFGVSVKDSVDLSQDMYPKEVSPPPTPSEEPTATYQPCRFSAAGVKRKLDFDSCDEGSPGDPSSPLGNGEVEVGSESVSSEYMDRQRMLEVSLGKMRRMEDPETSLRRCVLINNMTVKLKRELDRRGHHHHHRTLLPKKRHILRRTDSGAVPLDSVGPLAHPSPGCGQENHVGDKFPRRTWEPSAGECELMATPHTTPYRVQEDSLRNQRDPPTPTNLAAVEGDPSQCNQDTSQSGATSEESTSIFGDIDNVFQSLLSCLGEPI